MNTTSTPAHLWIVGVLLLLWNGMGAFDYSATQLKLDFYMSNFSQEQLDFFYGFPAWVVAAWATAVWSATLGALALLLKKRWAIGLFALAIIGLLITSIHNFGMTDGAEIMGQEGVIFSGVIWLVSVLQLVYARAMAKRGVLS